MSTEPKTPQSFLEKHPQGTFLARPVDWAITKTQAGLPQVVVTLRYQNGDLNWYGSFKDTVVERTVDALLLMGLQGDLSGLAEGNAGTALNKNKDVEIVVEHRADLKGIMRAGISWINDPAKLRVDKVDKAEAASLLSGVNAILLQKRQNTAAATAPMAPIMQPRAQAADIPF